MKRRQFKDGAERAEVMKLVIYFLASRIISILYFIINIKFVILGD
jgi:hypothetical protein